MQRYIIPTGIYIYMVFICMAGIILVQQTELIKFPKKKLLTHIYIYTYEQTAWDSIKSANPDKYARNRIPLINYIYIYIYIFKNVWYQIVKDC